MDEKNSKSAVNLYYLSVEYSNKGAFNNQVDKKGWVGGLKFAILVHI